MSPRQLLTGSGLAVGCCMRAGLLSRQGHEQHRLLATNIEMSDRNVDMLAADAAASAFACVSPGTETRHMQVALMKHTAGHASLQVMSVVHASALS